jgi:hypothetical protein
MNFPSSASAQPHNEPPPLSLDVFIRAVHDLESSQFQVLSGLKRIHTNFHHNKIYPDLSALIELHSTLQSIAHNADMLESLVPKRLADFNLQQGLVYEQQRLRDSDFDTIRELIEWALPHIQRAIEEGRTMFEFIDDSITLDVVGILPTYLEEGYFFVPDNITSSIHLIRYEVSIFTSANERFRSLKTSLIKTIQHGSQTPIVQPSQSIKLALMSEFPDMPNPATFAFSTDLEFPFQESVLPVAKRRLLRRLYS